jgi:hypothetical protein
MRAELDRQSPWPLNVQEHSLVAARSADRNPEAPFVDYLRSLYAEQPPDLIIVVGAPAASFIRRHRKDLFPTAPMLFTTVEQRRVRMADLTETPLSLSSTISASCSKASCASRLTRKPLRSSTAVRLTSNFGRTRCAGN